MEENLHCKYQGVATVLSLVEQGKLSVMLEGPIDGDNQQNFGAVSGGGSDRASQKSIYD